MMATCACGNPARVDVDLCESCFTIAMRAPERSPEIQAAVNAFWLRLPAMKPGDAVTVSTTSNVVTVPAVGTVMRIVGDCVTVELMTGRRVVEVRAQDIDALEVD